MSYCEIQQHRNLNWFGRSFVCLPAVLDVNIWLVEPACSVQGQARLHLFFFFSFFTAHITLASTLCTLRCQSSVCFMAVSGETERLDGHALIPSRSTCWHCPCGACLWLHLEWTVSPAKQSDSSDRAVTGCHRRSSGERQQIKKRKKQTAWYECSGLCLSVFQVLSALC